MLAHNLRGRYQWYGRRGWTFLPIPCYILLLHNRGSAWQTDAWHGSAYEAEVSHWIPQNRKKKWHPLIYTNTSEYLQRPNRGCEHSETVGSAFQQCDSNMKYKSFWTAKHSSHTMKWRVRWADQDTSQLVAVTMLKKCFLAENLLYQIMLLRSLHLLEFTWE